MVGCASCARTWNVTSSLCRQVIASRRLPLSHWWGCRGWEPWGDACISVGGGGGGGSIYIGHNVMVTWDAKSCCRVEKIVMELRRYRGSVVAKNLPDQSAIRSFFCYVLGTISKHRQYVSWCHGASPWQKTLHFRVLFQIFNTAIW